MSVSRKKAARRRRRTVTEKEEGFVLSTTAKSVLWAFLVTVVTGLLLLLLATALLLQTSDPNRYQTVTGCVLIYLTAFIGGFAALRLNRRCAPLLCGAGEGALLLLALLAAGLCMPAAWKNGVSTGLALLLHACLIPCAMLGAWIGSLRPAQRRRRRR